MQQEFDYIIIGSGIAGLFGALAAQQEGNVLLLTKGNIHDSNTRYAQGGIAAAVGPDDSSSLHLQDTLRAGAGLCDETAARILTYEGPQRVAELMEMGIVFDQLYGATSLGREGAHSQARVLHAGGDATGMHIELTLADLARSSKIHIVEHALATRINIDEDTGAAVGVEVLEVQGGRQMNFKGRNIILATGGVGQLFRSTTNSEVATGDGVALAFRAGAEIMDMEFYQFHPTVLNVFGAPRFLISEAVRGEGGVLINAHGERFMGRYHPWGDLAPRDIVSRAIVNEMENTGVDYVSLDLTHLSSPRIIARFPNIHQTCLHHGLDITREPIPVAPAAHYMMGGIKTTVWGETTVPNLYACGEVSCTGVHGANRLASNSLLETIVFSKRIIERTRKTNGLVSVNPIWDKSRRDQLVSVLYRSKGKSNSQSLDRLSLQDLMWHNMGIMRSEEDLQHVLEILTSWIDFPPKPGDLTSHELSNMVTVGWLAATAALMRQESRGAHYRSDYPDTLGEWAHHIALVKSG
jgi:L-aspartate oxidase